MHVILDTNTLRAGLKHVLGVVERRNSLPILACVHMRVNASAMTITASDMELEVQTEIATASTKSNGAVCVDAALLAAIVTKIPAAQITLQTKLNRLHVKAEGAAFQLNCLSPDEFPVMPNNLGEGFDLAAETLRHLLDSVAFSVSTEETRYYLNGVFLHSHKKMLRAVATDGHRLALSERDDTCADFPAAIVPSKTVGVLLKLLEGASSVAVAIRENKARFVIGTSTITSKLVDGDFPDYERIFPQSSERILTVPAAELAASIERIACVADSKTRCVKFHLGKDLLTVSSRSDDGEATEILEVDYAGAPVTTGFNSRYVLDVLKKITTKVRIDFGADGLSTALFNEAGSQSVKFIVMPMKV